MLNGLAVSVMRKKQRVINGMGALTHWRNDCKDWGVEADVDYDGDDGSLIDADDAVNGEGYKVM